MKQQLDENCCFDCVVKDEGKTLIVGTGSILCQVGYESGKHCWEFLAKHCGFHSWAGVSTRDPGDELQVTRGHAPGNLEGAFVIAGLMKEQGKGDFYPFHAGEQFISNNSKPTLVPFFQCGDKVRFVLDCDEGTLLYYLNDEFIDFVFKNKLPRHVLLFPIFGGTGLETEFTQITFDIPIN